MTKNDITSKLQMPEFVIDSFVDSNGTEHIGIKRMYDIALAIKDSLMQWGGPGLGKSQAVLQWNQDQVKKHKGKGKPWNPEVCDVRLSMKEPVDMVGVPIPTKNSDGSMATVWATPSVWPKDDGKYCGGVIHLDEINQGNPSILNAAFQLIQDRALGEYKVPEGYIIIASANPSAYNNTVSELSVPLSNRFSHFNVKPDFETWLNYRQNNGGNVDVMAFLKSQDQSLLFDRQGMEKQIGSSMKDALYTDIVVTPRSWEVVEKVLNLPDEFTFEEKRLYVSGRLGLATATKFFNWLKDKEKYQSWQEILVKGNNFKSEETESFFVTQLACMSAIINEKDDKKCREYILNMIKATRNLKSISFKTMNVTQLIRSPRIKGRIDLFNPMVDMKDLLSFVAKIIRN